MIHNNPFISIIVPTYNRAHLVSKTIDSVLSQNFTDWELIVVDDGSTDNTKEVVQSYIDKRIKYIYQDNSERGAARNNGVRNALGEYVFFLDSDDLIYTNHLQHAKENLEKLNYPEFFHNRYEEIFSSKIRQSPKLDDGSIFRKTLVQNHFGTIFFLRKDIAKKFPFIENPEIKIGEDWHLVLRIATRYQLHFSNEVHIGVVHHERNSMKLSSGKEILLSLELIIEDLSKDPTINDKIINNVRSDLMTLAALSFAMEGKRKPALNYLIKVILFRPNQLFKRRTLAIIKHTIYGKK